MRCFYLFTHQCLKISEPSKMILLFFVLLIVHFASSASDTFPTGLNLTVKDPIVDCKFDRSFKVTLASILNCCEVELKCLEYGADGVLLTQKPEHKILLANIKSINGWRATNRTQAVIICAPVLNDEGAIQNWENNADFRIKMANTTKPFLLKNIIKYIRFYWNELQIGTDKKRQATKRTIDLLDESCGSNCDVLYSKEFRDSVYPQQCAVRKFNEDKKKKIVKSLTDCTNIFTPRNVTYIDGYADLFDMGEPVINMKKVQSCKANYAAAIIKKVHCEFRSVFEITLDIIRYCCEVVVRCLQYDENGKPTLPEPHGDITLANIEKINNWRAANMTQAELICAPALNRDLTVAYWSFDAEFLKNVKKSTLPFLQKHRVYNLEFFMIEFGLESEEEESKLLTEVKELKNILVGIDVFYDHTYEMASNPYTCLVNNLKKTREEDAFRYACDQHFLNNPKFLQDLFGFSFLKIYYDETDDEKLKEQDLKERKLKDKKYEEGLQKCEAEGPSRHFFALKILYQGYNMDQCEDLNYPKLVAYNDTSSIITLNSGLNVARPEQVLGCWLFIGQWYPDTSGKGKWFSPWV